MRYVSDALSENISNMAGTTMDIQGVSKCDVQTKGDNFLAYFKIDLKCDSFSLLIILEYLLPIFQKWLLELTACSLVGWLGFIRSQLLLRK